MIDIFNIHNELLSKGMDQMRVKLFYKEPKEIQTYQEDADKVETYVYDRVNLKFRNGALETWTETQKIHPDPLPEARKAVDEAVKLNTDGKANADIIDIIKKLKIAFELAAVNAYDDKDFKTSHSAFLQMLDLNAIPLMNNWVDTLDIYYGGRAAFENKDYKEANRLFELAASYNYSDPFLFVFRKQSYFASGDTASGVQVIKDGFMKYPEDQSIMIELINYYLLSNQSDEALRLISVAKTGDPSNMSLFFTEGFLYEKTGRYEEAEKAYKTCIEAKPDVYDYNYSLGVLYYNQAVKIYEDASRIADNTEFEKVQQQGDEMLKKSIPYMEKASQINPTDRNSIDTLRTIFYRLKAIDPAFESKYQEVMKKLSEL
jgi:tetratricopeptide (TPR) repeat protein